MRRTAVTGLAVLLLLGGLADCSFASSAASAPGAQRSDTARSAPQARRKSPYRPESITPGARDYIAASMGVDDLRVRRTNAGNLIRFSYRVVDGDQAKILNDRAATPQMIGHDSRVVLSVPVMDKVGPLRQSTEAIAGKEYWMVFSNKGDWVKSGERVSVVIGSFRVDGLLVE